MIASGRRRVHLYHRSGGRITGRLHRRDPAPVQRDLQAPQRRRATALSVTAREEISRGVAADESYRAIGCRIGRPASTIRREIARNKGAARYRAVNADDRTWRRAKRSKPCLLAQRPARCAYVTARRQEEWSPEQIAGTFAKQHPDGVFRQTRREVVRKGRTAFAVRPFSATVAGGLPQLSGHPSSLARESCRCVFSMVVALPDR